LVASSYPYQLVARKIHKLMSKTIKFIPLVALLVLHMTVVRCSCINENEANKKRLEKKIEEEQQLIETFKQNFSPDQGKKFEETLAKRKTNYTPSDWETEIKEVKVLQTEIKLSQDDPRSEFPNHFKAIEIIKRLIPDLSAVDIKQNQTAEIIRIYLAILYNITEQDELSKHIK